MSWNNLTNGSPPPTVKTENLDPPTLPGLPNPSGKTISSVTPIKSGTTPTVNYGQKTGSSSAKPAYKSCYHSHPPYEIAPGILIYGGSGNSPAVTDADIYIGFDHGMQRSWRRFPWNRDTGTDEVWYPITDRDVPLDLESFMKLLAWTAEQLIAGKKVHAGCIGGHGRTGLFFAALRMVMTGDKDGIMHARKHYCDHAVESRKQVDWLVKNFGMTEAVPYDDLRKKSWSSTPAPGKGSYQHSPGYHSTRKGGTTAVVVGKLADAIGSIWRPNA